MTTAPVLNTSKTSISKWQRDRKTNVITSHYAKRGLNKSRYVSVHKSCGGYM